jgi:nucleoside-diphosphate-sugar epimerase
MTKLELCELIKLSCPWFEWHEVEGKQDPDRRDCRVSNQKLYRTGWDAKYSLSYGIAELMEGYASSTV